MRESSKLEAACVRWWLRSLVVGTYKSSVCDADACDYIRCQELRWTVVANKIDCYNSGLDLAGYVVGASAFLARCKNLVLLRTETYAVSPRPGLSEALGGSR